MREPTTADLPRLRELFLDARRKTFHWNDPAIYKLSDFDTETEGETLLLADVRGAIAGFVAWWAPENFVHHLYIDSAFQRRGLGQLLLQGCLDRLGGKAQLKCVARNTPAVAFYQALGWRILQTDTGPEGEFHLMGSPRTP